MRRARKLKSAVILGCGPAGIFAAHAAVQRGLDTVILSHKRVSQMFGAQYLHRPIPGLSATEPRRIAYTLTGTADQYAEKVYGQMSGVIAPSVASLVGVADGWDIREAYFTGYEKYADIIRDQPRMGPEDIKQILASGDRSVYFVNTIPLDQICAAPHHQFATRSIWTIGDAPELGQVINWVDIPENTVRCNGEKSPSWYRAANVFGHKTLEWPDSEIKPPISGVVRAQKVVGTNCSCWLPWLRRAGRMGTFTKGVLAHSAYYETEAALS